MPAPTPIHQSFLDITPASNFRAGVTTPASNQVEFEAGNIFTPGTGMVKVAAQTSAALPVVSSGYERTDLLGIDQNGNVVRQAGTEVLAGAAAYAGAPGTATGPQINDNMYPIAWIFVDETATVVIDEDDITPVPGFTAVQRSLIGVRETKGTFTAPSAANIDVSSNFSGDTAGGTSTSVGVITSAPLNIVRLVDVGKDELQTADGNAIYGRITESSGTWILTFFYTDAAGTETAIADLVAAGVTGTVEMLQVPVVYSMNDTSRPLFTDGWQQISDQMVGDIPTATESVEGKVELATSAETTAGKVVQASDTRLPTQDENDALAGTSGTPSSANKYVTDDDSRLDILSSYDTIARAPISFRYHMTASYTMPTGGSRDVARWAETTTPARGDQANYSATLHPTDPPVEIDGTTGRITLTRPPSGVDYIYHIAFSTNRPNSGALTQASLHEVDGPDAIDTPVAEPLAQISDPSSNTTGTYENSKSMMTVPVVVDSGTTYSNYFEIQVVGVAVTANNLERTAKLHITRQARLSDS